MDYSKAYGELHSNPKRFPGYTLKRYAADVAQLVDIVQPRAILDYGCGKGYQYLKRRVHEQWGGVLPYCYDIGVPALSEKPDRKFDGVISTDVLEHIEGRDIPAFLDDALGFLADDHKAFAFLSAGCRPAKRKRLPDGRNVHVTVKPPEWWRVKIREAIARRGHHALTVHVAFELDQHGREIVREDLTEVAEAPA